MNIRYTPEAISDLARLREFIAIKNPVAAQRIAKNILFGIDEIRTFPRMGRHFLRGPQSELMRDFFIGTYTIRYLIAKEEIIVLRLWHGKELEKDL